MPKPSMPPSSTNKAPTAVTLSSSIVAENADASTDIGVLKVADPNKGETFSFVLSDGRFELVPGAKGSYILQLADSAEIDYEAAQSGIPLRKAGNLRLQAGMPAEVYIKTTSRNALQYLLDPISGFLQRSLREH